MHTGMSVESPVLSNGHAGFGGAGRGNGSPETATPRPGPTLHMELDRRGAELLFQVLTEREERNSVAIASNESFGGWTKTFTDPRLCAAIVDRLTFGGNIIETGTSSYRLAHTRRQDLTTGRARSGRHTTAKFPLKWGQIKPSRWGQRKDLAHIS
jgi:IstB-like ATP binding protein